METQSQTKTQKVEKILFYIVLIIHAATILEFFFHIFHSLASESVLAVLYIILGSGVYCWFFYQKSKEDSDRIDEYKHEIETEKLKYLELQRYYGYSDAFKDISNGFSEIHEMQRYYQVINTSAKKEDLEQVLDGMIADFQMACNHFTNGFRKITNNKESQLSVCIKYIHEKEAKETSIVKTLTRDGFNEKDRYFDEGSIHVIHKNTAYTYIFKNIKQNKKGHCFFNNTLPLLKGYNNTSKQNYNQQDYPENMSNEERIKNWKLPYKSTIVAGICPNIAKRKQPKNLIGFVCVDSSEMDFFIQEKDIDIMLGIADGLYNAMRIFKELSTRIAQLKK